VIKISNFCLLKCGGGNVEGRANKSENSLLIIFTKLFFEVYYRTVSHLKLLIFQFFHFHTKMFFHELLDLFTNSGSNSIAYTPVLFSRPKIKKLLHFKLTFVML